MPAIVTRPLSQVFTDRAAGREGLVCYGAGGDPQEWYDGVLKALRDEGHVDAQLEFDDAYLIQQSERRDIVLVLPKTGVNFGTLALWRIRFGECSWLSDYADHNSPKPDHCDHDDYDDDDQ